MQMSGETIDKSLEEERPKDRSLGDSRCHRKILRVLRVNSSALAPVKQIGLKPLAGDRVEVKVPKV